MGLYLLAQVVAALFGFITLGAVLWFASSMSWAVLIAALIFGLSSVAAAFSPRSKLPSGEPRRIVFSLCLVGIAAGFVLVASDISRSLEDEWPAVIMRLVQIAALAAIAIETLERSPKST